MGIMPSTGERDKDAAPIRQEGVRALLVVSRVTFVPDNYNALVCALADCPQVAGLLVLDNRAPKLVRRAVGLLLLGAWRLGMTLLRNYFGDSDVRRRRAYAAAGKPIRQLATINCPEAAELVRREGIDLLVNARTRFIYRREILAAPRLGCINIHHGLLPDQRGAMCDLWALAERRPAGFSIHRMSPLLDDGDLLCCVQVSDGQERDYSAYLLRSSEREASMLREVLADIARLDRVPAAPNVPSAPIAMRHEPAPAQIRAMLRDGMQL
jgi:hypothetical protein